MKRSIAVAPFWTTPFVGEDSSLLKKCPRNNLGRVFQGPGHSKERMFTISAVCSDPANYF